MLEELVVKRLAEFARRLNGDQVLHPSVYMPYHFSILKKLSPGLRFDLARLLFGSRKNSVRARASPGGHRSPAER